MITTTAWEVDLRSRKTGDSIETIFSGEHEDACKILENWYKEHPEIDAELPKDGVLEDYVDGSDGVFADIYATSNPHGLGKW